MTNLTGDMILLCAGCGSDFTHHSRVTVHARPAEDGPTVTHVTTYGQERSHPPLPPNPSHRRDGVTIEYTCETDCEASSALDIWQHKGQTYIATRLRDGE